MKFFRLNKNISPLFIIVIGFVFLELKAAPIEVQVMAPWPVYSSSSMMPLNSKNDLSASTPLTRIPSLMPYILDPIINGLDRFGLLAYPALYSSCVQLVTTFDSKSSVDFLLSKEFSEQKKYLTIVPIVYGAQVFRRSMMVSGGMELKFRLELYCLNDQGHLGELLLKQDFAFPFQSKEDLDWNAIESIIPTLSEKIKNLPAWDSVATRLNILSKGSITSIKSKLDTTLSNAGIDRLYFAQSEIFSNLYRSQTKLSKANFQGLGHSNHDLNDLVFPFMANDKWPEFQYAYIINPGKNAIRIDMREAHVEQNPESVPSKIYDWSRVLVINLPGLQAGSIVTYAINYRVLQPESSLKKSRRVLAQEPPLLAKDIPIHPLNDEKFQVRVLVDPGDSIYFSSNDVKMDSISHFPLGRENIFLAEGKGLAYERFKQSPQWNPFYPVTRISNVQNWSQIYESVKDSVFSRIMPLPKNMKEVKNKISEDDLILEIHKFIQDSLRYISLSFGDRAYVPAFPDSVLKIKMGDCKDFTVLMISKLHQAGIAALPALVNSNNPQIFFPGPPSFDAADHMIVYLPNRNLWVDPTGGVKPPGMLPSYLSNAQAVVFFPDSVVLKRLPKNNDSAFAGSASYTCEQKGNDLKCDKLIVYSLKDSWEMRGFLNSVNPEKWGARLNPQNWTAPFRLTELEMHFKNRDLVKEKLVEERVFLAHNAISKVGGKQIIRFPEIPSQQLFYYATTPEDKGLMDISDPLFRTISFCLKTNKKIEWPKFQQVLDSNFSIRIDKSQPKILKILIQILPGQIQSGGRASIDKALNEFKDFFSSLIIEG